MEPGSEVNMNRLIAPCGTDCTQCEAYIATQNNDTELFNKLTNNYKQQFNKEIPQESLYCDGCPQNGRLIGFCAQCEIRACAFGKSYCTCADCDEFPCEKGSFIWTKNS
jgi:hypothetical protein